MGDMIEGIGDEVVLFVVFLAFSLLFLTLLSCLKRPGTLSGQQGESHAHQPEDARPEEQEEQPEAGADGLRHRIHVTGSGEEILGSLQQQSSDESGRQSSTVGGRQSSTVGGREDTSGQHPNADTPPSLPPPIVQQANDSNSSSDNSGRGTTEEDGRNEISVRLIQAAGSGHAHEVHVSPNTTLQYLRRTYFETELSEHCPVKFIYQGHLLSNDSTTLRDLGIGDGGAIHVHVGRPRPPGTPLEPPEPEMPDLSRFFVPLFGVILAVVWVAMLLYPFVFTLLSKLFLFLLSIGYVILTYASIYGN